MLNLHKLSTRLLEMYLEIWEKDLVDLNTQFFAFNGECQKKGAKNSLLADIRFHEGVIELIQRELRSRG
jgi:hypothetical protein